ncbi:Dehydrodolichyl diphosphate syntase complex subunit DHDDS [Folsomia candida]|uniref:ditrans,polycis-polyprenyl diphosphate synthase [(2E,6E)-farnesyldiphosphate specific] n=1 Tax=Folsomia candida TaxID=158441 RepID=A0A226E7H0_FOLCA|nr:Dehydrodolichyl diphosphate syntase complex subunit DHDDS [Folsomia candida]
MSVLEILAAPMTQIGKIPDHVALILDGNRRYAKSRGLPALKGHQAGDAGTIMDTSFQVIGNWEGLLPVKLQHRMAHLMIKTRHFKPYRFNMAVAYTGRQGILQSLNAFPDSKDEIMDNLRPSEYLIAQAQHLVDMSPVDMLIRTGGNLRLSDFMMWETSQAYIHFVPETWPEFSFWKLVHAILLYQVYRGSAEKVNTPVEPNEHNFLDEIRNLRWTRIEHLARKDTYHDGGNLDFSSKCAQGLEKILHF